MTQVQITRDTTRTSNIDDNFVFCRRICAITRIANGEIKMAWEIFLAGRVRYVQHA